MRVLASSDGIGNGDVSYSLMLSTIRKQWTLVQHTDTMATFDAYFVSEGAARTFAETFGLTITEHK